MVDITKIDAFLPSRLDVNGVAAQKRPELEAQLQATLNVIPAYTWYALPSGALVFVNERTADYLGLPKDHALRFGIDTGAERDSHIPLLHPDDHEETRRTWSTCLRTGCAGEMTVRVRNAEGAYRWFLSRIEPLRASDGTLLYWIGINLDIDDGKRAEDALRKSEKELRDAIDTIPAIVWSALPDGSNTYVNKRFVEYSGSSAEQTAGSGWQALIHPDDLERHEGKWMEAVATGKPHENEVRSRRSDGQYRWQLDRGVPLRDEDGNIVKWYGVTTDIEDRKCAEEALRRNEFYLTEGQRLAHMGSWAFNATGFNYWSSELFRVHGLDPRGKPPTVEEYLAFVHPEDRAFMKQGITQMLVDHRAFDFTKRIVRPDGKIRSVRCVGVPVTQEGTFQGFLGTGMDVTEQERLAEELRLSEHYLSEGQRLAHMGSWVFNPAGFFSHWSRELLRIYGLDPAQEAPNLEEYLALIYPQDREFMRSLIKKMVAEASGCDVTKRIVRPNGELRYIRCVGTPVVENGTLQRIVGTAVDVTEHELLTQELRRREAYLADAQRLSHTGSFGWKPDSGEIVWSEETYRIFEYDHAVKPTIDLLVQSVHPEDRPDFLKVIESASAGATQFEHTYRWLLPDGSVKHVHALAHALKDASGNREFVGAATDVTSIKRAEEELRTSEAYLAEAQRLSQTGSWAWHPVTGDIRYWSEECYRVLGFDPHGPPPRFETFFQRLHPDDQCPVREQFEKAIRDKSDFEFGYRIVHPDKGVRDIHVVGHAVLDRSGELNEFVGTVIDITERKRAEDDLRQAFDEIKKLKDQLYRENLALRDEVDRTSMFEEIVGTSKPLSAVLSRIAKVAPADTTVLITGETGTGKELIARAVHKRSRRSGRAFVSVNCAAIPRDLIASELFGHEKGAFTGAMQRRLGRFEMADGGTIFVDEVGELSADTQVAFLRVLQEREFERVGGGQPIRVDVRVIAATNRDLQAAVANGTFRQDLFYRLNVFPIEVPPLRERKDDILMLVEYFAQRYASRAGKTIRSIDKRTLDVLQSYQWPGNIRELQNVIERSVILSSGEVLSVDEMWLSKETSRPASRVEAAASFEGEVDPRSEREIIEAALAESRGRVSGSTGAAAKLGVPPSTLDHRIKALKINKNQFKFRQA
jgi:PAS domain S-box-containing protein